MALSVKQLTEKKVRLSTQLETLSADTEAKIIKLQEAHTERINDLTTALEAKVTATRDGIIARKEKLEDEIILIDKQLEEEVATLQAQIEAIRGIESTVTAPTITTEEEDLV